MKIFASILLLLSFILFAQDDCPITNSKPSVSNFDFNFMSCFNLYVVDLGIDSATNKCKTLIKTQDFNEENFSKCISIYQPIRAEWKASLVDKCIDLAKKHNFLSGSFDSCLNIFSITDSASSDKEKKNMKKSGAEKCLTLSMKVDFTSKSFANCFSFYGGNHWPLMKKEAESSLLYAELCGEQVQKFDFASDKMIECWNNNRRTPLDRKQIVEKCMKENN